MASTRNLLDTINWAEPFVSYKPTYLGNGGEPAVTNANIILQTVLGPPFRWRWNRNTSGQFIIKKGTTDVQVVLPTFGWMEKAYLTSAAAQPSDPKIYEIPEITALIAPTAATETDRPHSICALLDDNKGNITFRVSPTCDQDYNAWAIFQGKAPLLTCLGSPWAPIPDELMSICEWGFLALGILFDDDPRFQVINARFVGSLLATAEGITEMERNAFLDRWNNQIGQLSSDQARRTQGEKARG